MTVFSIPEPKLFVNFIEEIMFLVKTGDFIIFDDLIINMR